MVSLETWRPAETKKKEAPDAPGAAVRRRFPFFGKHFEGNRYVNGNDLDNRTGVSYAGKTVQGVPRPVPVCICGRGDAPGCLAHGGGFAW